MKKNLRFVGKITIAHTVTYFVCGLIFATLFDYENLFQLGNAQYYMRDAYGVSSMIGPVAQIIRGAILGAVLLLIRDSIWGKQFPWLRLWGVLAGIGIICTSAAAPVSIEGLVYSKLPLEFHLKTSPEILTQTLLFSVWVTESIPLKLPAKYKTHFIVTAIAAVGFSLGGVLLALALHADVMKSASDPFAFVVMAFALAIVWVQTTWYQRHHSKRNLCICCVVFYLALAGLPTVYNYLTDSLLASPLSLIFSGLPVIGIGIYLAVSSRISHYSTRER